MSNQKISQLTSYTTPIDTDVAPIVDITNSITKKITWANIKANLKSYLDSATSTFTNKTIDGTVNTITNTTGFSFQSFTSIATPADATRYFFGAGGFTGSTTQGFYRYYMPKDCTLKVFSVETFYTGTQPTSETSSVYYRINSGADVQIFATFHNEGNGARFYADRSISLSKNDYIEFNWVTPTWATNPGTSIVFRTTLYLE